MKMLYRAAEVSVSIARLLMAALYFTIAILLFAFTLWLSLPIDQNWSPSFVAAVVGLMSFVNLIKAAEILLTTKPPERKSNPQQRPGR